MATISGSPSGSIFMGNPIIVTVVSSALATENAAFHRVRLEVTVTCTSSSVPTTKYELSQPISGKTAQTVEFDISSCFRAAADLYEFSPVTSGITYPVFSASYTAKDVWVEEGLVCESQGAAVGTGSFQAVIGHYTDYERRKGILTVIASRKPSTGELVHRGDLIVYPSYNQGGRTASVKSVSSDATYYSTVSIPGVGTATVVPADRKSSQFQFVNSRGMIETIRAFGLPSEKIVSEKKENTISRFERFTSFSRTLLRKYLKPSEFSMSSGYVTYEWAKWWAYEFCQSTHHWMLVDGAWMPVLVTINDSATIIDRSKVGLCYIEFTVKPDGNGGLW